MHIRTAAESASEQWPIGPRERALWLLQQMVPDLGISNVVFGVECAHPVDTVVLGEAVNWAVRRHPALRSFFSDVDGVPMRGFRPPEVTSLELGVAPADPEGLAEQIKAFGAPAFDLTSDLLIRGCQFVLPTGGSVIAFAAHHLVFDGGSVRLFLQDVDAAFESLMTSGGFPDLPPVAPPPVDEEPSAESLAYWRERLGGIGPTTMELACARPMPQAPTFAGARLVMPASPSALRALTSLRKVLRVTDNAILLSLYYLLLAKHGATGPDLVVGVPLTLRSPQSGAVGYFVTTVALPVRLDEGLSFAEFAHRVQDSFMAGVQYLDAPFEVLDLNGATDAAWHRLVFRHMFNFIDQAETDTWFAGGPARRLRPAEPDTGLSRLDMEVVAERSEQGLVLQAVYSTEVHDEDQIRALLERFENLLAQVAADPECGVDALSYWTPADRRLVDRANDTSRQWSGPATVLDVVRAQVLRTPEAVALIEGEERFTYRALAAAATRMRDDLAAAGVRPGDAVALACPRGARAVAAVLGIWAAGAHYLPLDASHPADRLAGQLADANVSCVVHDGDLAPSCLVGRTAVPTRELGETDALPADMLRGPVPSRADDPAYVIFTSGSTGRPKGVKVSHGNLRNVTACFADLLEAGPGETMMWLTTFAFDVSALELFLPLTVGGSVLVAPDEARSDAEVFGELVRRHRPEILQATPTTWRLAVTELPEKSLADTRVLCGGEPLSAALAQRLSATGCRLFNVYGPTETTIWSAAGEVDGSGVITVGRPIANTRVHILDGTGAEMPPGMPGELCIAGAGVALGYLDRPELTAERFVHHPTLGSLYRTGDIAHWTHSGELRLVGRADRQVKIRGNRLELGEVEAVLERHPSVEEAAAVVVGADDDVRLLAFVRGSAEGESAGTDLWQHIQDALPPYARPSGLVPVETMPRTANDKVDYRALAALGEVRAAQGDFTVQTETSNPEDVSEELLEQLVDLWRTLLKNPDLGPSSHFFRNGGHSLLATRLAARLHRLVALRLAIREIYDAPTPLELARYIETIQSDVDHDK
ncbi:amino acid adenylation domain-containing protein [Streptomyces sp. NPDC007856]|uniref:non-ribosomal peptide synthetase n=1 Tax=Streptomyces sp. NPDC007856 TaxID=3364781 RepID=UPI00369B5063